MKKYYCNECEFIYDEDLAKGFPEGTCPACGSHDIEEMKTKENEEEK